MDIYDRIKKIEDEINSIERRLLGGGGGGEANTGGNLGAGVGVYDGKVGVQLQFRSLVEAGGIDIALDAVNDEIDLALDADLDDLNDVDAAAPNDGDVLTYDAGAGNWEAVAPSAAGSVNPFAFRRSGRVYSSWSFYGTTTQSITRDFCYAMPFIVPTTQTFDRYGIYVSTARTNGVARVGIYDDDGDVYPDNLLDQSDPLDATAIGYKYDIISSTNRTLSPGLYWLVINSDGDADIAVRAIDYNLTSPQNWFAIIGHPAGNWISPPYFLWRVSQAYGNLPDPFPGGATAFNNINLPLIMLRVD